MSKIKQVYNSIAVIPKMHMMKNYVQKKYVLWRTIFILLSILSIAVSASVVVLNLYSIRWNSYPNETMAMFVAISFISSISTFLISIQSFLNLSNRKNKLRDNLARSNEITLELKAKTDLSQEDIDNISELFS
ncbi:hypothetical protein [Mycoplasma sp. 6243]|uniref:hypothetical protein n=1 Tax=Mycoplasma sp. 6243 TaxID=3440865 RepID=UPI003EB82C9C